MNTITLFIVHIVLIILSVANAMTNNNKVLRFTWIIASMCWFALAIFDALNLFGV